jgi:hypothetical protein
LKEYLIKSYCHKKKKALLEIIPIHYELKTNSLDNQLLVAMRAKVLGMTKIRDKFNEFKNVG